jgi:hypothetical protein
MLFVGAAVALACASMGPPPGGPEDKDPPRIVALSPDTNARAVTSREISITFDEVIQEPARMGGRSSLERMLIISPDPGDLDIEWHRNRLTIAPKRGFRANTAYRVTLLPGISDLVNHPTTSKTSWVFATGDSVPRFRLSGRVFDWMAERPAPGALVRAAMADPNGGDSVVYWAVVDSVGAFDIEPLENSAFAVRGFIDANGNRRLDAREKESGVKAVRSAIGTDPLELLLVERDTAPPKIASIDILDSVSIQLNFDKPIDPFLPLQPVLVQVLRPDSSELVVTEVVQRAEDQSRRRAAAASAAADSAAIRAATDSTGARGQPPPGGGRGAPPPAAPPRESTAPRPSAAPPFLSIVATLATSNPIARDQEVWVTARGLRGVAGTARPHTMTIKRPR